MPHQLISVLLITSAAICAQDLDTRQTYSKLCAGCHGEDARGTQQGPGLVGNSRVKRRSVASIKTVISKGIPAARMPAFNLPAPTVDALAELVVSLNASAADITVPGDRAAGKAFFAGPGKCASCHILSGSGTALGPDLSDVARRQTVDQLRDSLVNPSAHLAAGYGVVTLQLRDGRTLKGFARSRTRFDLTLQDLQGRLHPISLGQVTKIAEDNSSLMPVLKASPAELQNLLAYLSHPIGGTLPTTPNGGITFADLLNPAPGDWLT